MSYSDSDCFVGEIRMFGGSFAPMGWALCNGQTVPISGNEALYSLIGVTYGGDGKTNFALPDLRGRLPIGTGQGQYPNGTPFANTYPLGAKGGTYTVTLQQENLPPHNHNLYGSTAAADSVTPNGGIFATTATGYGEYLPTNATGIARVSADPNMLSYIGGNGPHNNVMPYLGVSYIIALSGQYPSES